MSVWLLWSVLYCVRTFEMFNEYYFYFVNIYFVIWIVSTLNVADQTIYENNSFWRQFSHIIFRGFVFPSFLPCLLEWGQIRNILQNSLVGYILIQYSKNGIISTSLILCLWILLSLFDSLLKILSSFFLIIFLFN